MEFVRVYLDNFVHPNGSLCTVEVASEGESHEGPHCYTEWVAGYPAFPVYWRIEKDGSLTEWVGR